MSFIRSGLEEARRNYEEAVAYCRKRKLGCSEWKGLMLAADWLGSAYGEDVEAVLPRLFVIPDLSCYDNPDPLYPLSLRDARDGRRHTMVVASTDQERPLSFSDVAGEGYFIFCLSRLPSMRCMSG